MGSAYQSKVEEEDRQRKRMQEGDWPGCDRCGSPLDWENVELSCSDHVVDHERFCDYCDHVVQKEAREDNE